MDNSYEQQQIDLVVERDALKAQVNALRDGVQVFNRSGGNMNPLLKAYLSTHEQCLNSVKADAIDTLGNIMEREFGGHTGSFVRLYVDKLRAINEAS
jgi:hypothetical protein